MSSNLKAQLKTLLDAKEYRAAIVLLESSSLPDKQVYIERIKKRIAEEAPVREKAKPLIQESKKPQSRRRMWMYIAAIVGVIAVGAVILIGYRSSQSSSQYTDEQIAAYASLKVYCQSIEAPQDCESWAASIVVERWDAAEYCEGHSDWIEDKQEYTLCLLILGVSSVPGMTFIEQVQTSDWKSGDYRVIGQLTNYCDGKYNEYYCTGWAVLNYRDNRTAIWNCDQSHKLDTVGFTNCVIALGVKV